MKVGIGSYAFRWAVGTKDFRPPLPLTCQTLLEKAVACEAEVVQICDNLPLDGLSASELTQLREQAESLGLELEVGVNRCDLAFLKRHLEICQSLGSKLLRVVLGDSASQTQITSTLMSLTSQLHALDIKLAIENHFRFTPRELGRMIETVEDTHIGVCLDPLNSLSLLVGPHEVLETLAPYALSVHVKDARALRQGTGFYLQGCPLGQGLVDVVALVKSLKSHGRTPNLLLEGWMDRLDDPQATVDQEEAWVREGLTYCRGIL